MSALRHAILVFITLLLAPSAGAAGATAIINGRILVGDGRVVEDGTVVFQGDRILAVGTEVAVPPGATVVDARGLWVTPGLIEPYTSIGLVEVAMERTTSDLNESTATATPELRAVDGINPDSALVAVARVGGVTTVHTSPGSVNPINGQTIMLDLAGHTVDRMMVASGTFLVFNLGKDAGRPGGSAAGSRYPSTRMGRVAFIRQTLYDAQAAGRREDAPRRGDAARPQRGRNLRNEALQAALERRIGVIMAASEVPEIRSALALAAEFNLDVVLLNPRHAWKCLAEIKAAGVPVLLGTTFAIPGDSEPHDRYFSLAAALHGARIPFAFTTGRGHAARTLPSHAGVSVAHGLPAEVAFRALTLEPARILGIADRYGSLEPGKVANVVVWNGDPLQNRTRVERLFIRGAEIPLTSRHEMLRDRFADPAQVH